MKSRVLEIALLLAGFGIVVTVALVGASQRVVSVPSTFDTGPNGYAALYHVLEREGVRVGRLRGPFDLRDPHTRVVAFTSMPFVGQGFGATYDANDLKRFRGFEHGGGKLVYFGETRDGIVKRMHHAHLKVQVLDVTRYTNLALSKHPQNVVTAYDALAGQGLVLFDERLHGYTEGRSMWSVLPSAVRIALWVALLGLLIVLVDANVRAAPPIVREAPADRDSAAYVVSMAMLLRRARARAAAIARFAGLDRDDPDLQQLARIAQPNDATLVQAAQRYFTRRKERS